MKKARFIFGKLIKFFILFTIFALGPLFIFYAIYDLILEKYIKTDFVFVELIIEYLSLYLFLLLYKTNKLPIKNKGLNNKKKNNNKIHIKIIIIQLLAVMLLFLSLFIIEELLFLKLGIVSFPGSESNPVSLFWIWIRALIFAPIFEEIIFRRIVFTFIKEYYNAITSSIITSLMFALCHGLGQVSISAFFCGILLCIVYHYTENVFITIWGHTVINASILIFGYMAKFQAPGIGFDMDIGRFQFNNFVVVLGFIVFALCLFYIIYSNLDKQKDFIIEN